MFLATCQQVFQRFQERLFPSLEHPVAKQTPIWSDHPSLGMGLCSRNQKPSAGATIVAMMTLGENPTALPACLVATLAMDGLSVVCCCLYGHRWSSAFLHFYFHWSKHAFWQPKDDNMSQSYDCRPRGRIIGVCQVCEAPAFALLQMPVPEHDRLRLACS